MRQTSNITGKSYIPEDTCIILNVVQVAAYMENGVLPLDIYVGRDRKLCFIFPKDKQTKELFEKWRNHEL